MSKLLTQISKKTFLRTLESLQGGSLELIAIGRTWEFGEANAPLRARHCRSMTRSNFCSRNRRML